jgi:hypothetical protein
MHPGRIQGSTRMLGAPQGWDKEKDGPCLGLAILDLNLNDAISAMGSVWFPTPEEIEKIVAGAPIELWIIGKSHPPVYLRVGMLPDQD